MDELRESNQSLFTWCLFLLGGAERRVDVEEIYQKCFELSPSRFSWRTRSDLPDSKKLSKAMVEAEVKKPSLILKYDVHTRGLSSEGLTWIQSNQERLEELYGGKFVPPSKTNQHRRLSANLKNHSIWLEFETRNYEASIFTLSDALNCSPGSPASIWINRIEEIRIAADVLEEIELKEFANFASSIYEKLGSQKDVG